jgi:hypothetical protein
MNAISPKTVNVILEVKFAYVVVFVYACLFTTWRQNTFLTNESSAAQTSYQYSQYGYVLLTTLLMTIYWLFYTMVENYKV